MPKYFTQDLTHGKNKHTFYGEMPAHDHNAGISFSKFCIDLMVKQYKCKKTDIEAGKYKSNQNKPSSGNEVKYNAKSKKWSQ
jgi:hypothetical protein